MPRLNICYIISNYDDMGMNKGTVYAFSKDPLLFQEFTRIRNNSIFLIKKNTIMTKSEYHKFKQINQNKKITLVEDESDGNIIALTILEKEWMESYAKHIYLDKLPCLATMNPKIFKKNWALTTILYKSYYDYYHIGLFNNIDSLKNKTLVILKSSLPRCIFESGDCDD